MASTSAVVQIGAAFAGTFNAVFGRAEKKAYSLGKAYQETNKKLAASRELIAYKGRLADLERQHAAGKKVSVETWNAVRAGHAKAAKEAHKLGLELGKIERQQSRLERQAISQRFGQGLASVRTKLAPVGTAVMGIGAAAATAGGALFALTANMAAAGSQTAKDARKLGMSVEALQEYQYVAERAGVSGSVFTDSLQKQAKKVSEAANGTGEAGQALAELGLDAEYLAELSPEKQFDLIADGLNGITNQNDRIRLAQKLWEDAGVDLLNATELGSEGMKALRAEGRATGAVLGAAATADAERFTDAMRDTSLAIGGVRNQVGAALLPEFTEMMRDLSGVIIENKDGIVEFGRGVGMAVKLTAQAIGLAYSVIKPVGEMIGETVGAIVMGVEKISNSRVGQWVARRFEDSGPQADAISRTPHAGAMAAGTAGGITNVGGITVNAAPGMDEAALARKVAEQLDERDRQAESRRRGAHHD